MLRNEIAVVLTDVSMPELDGFELAAMIREHPRFQRTAIIFVSAIHLTDPDRLRGYAAGAVDYLPVPLVPELMRAKVRVFAELYRKTRELELLNAELERRVEARTAELALANAQLEQRVEERTREREAALAQVHEMQKMESLGQLTGGVAHDFNNLLMAVLGNLELLKKRMPDIPALKRLVDGAIAGAERGATLTKRMLAFARRQELRPATVQLSALVEGMEDMLRRSLGPTITIEIDISESLPPVQIDPHQLELALLNLALNARDAMPNGGHLTITARRDERWRSRRASHGRLRLRRGRRYRFRNGRADIEARDGAVLYDEGDGEGNRAWSLDGARDGGAVGRSHADNKPGGPGNHGAVMVARGPRRGHSPTQPGGAGAGHAPLPSHGGR